MPTIRSCAMQSGRKRHAPQRPAWRRWIGRHGLLWGHGTSLRDALGSVQDDGLICACAFDLRGCVRDAKPCTARRLVHPSESLSVWRLEAWWSPRRDHRCSKRSQQRQARAPCTRRVAPGVPRRGQPERRRCGGSVCYGRAGEYGEGCRAMALRIAINRTRMRPPSPGHSGGQRACAASDGRRDACLTCANASAAQYRGLGFSATSAAPQRTRSAQLPLAEGTVAI